MERRAAFTLKGEDEEVAFHATMGKKMINLHAGASHKRYRVLLPGIARPRAVHLEGEANGLKWGWRAGQLWVTFRAQGEWTLRIPR